MADLKTYFTEHIRQIRLATQLGTLGFIIIIPILNREGFFWLTGTFYSLNIGDLTIVDPALVLQTLLLTQQIALSLLVAGIIPIVLAFFFGKIFCSWMCPYNFFAELLTRLRNRIFTRPAKKNRNPLPRSYWIIFIVILIVVTVTGIPFITLFSMPGQITAQITDAIYFGTIGIEVIFILILLGLDTLIFKRYWCKYLCPVGATLTAFQQGKSLRVSAETSRCEHCDLIMEHPCNIVCPLNLNPRSTGIYPYCYNCFECVQACHGNGKALSIVYKKQEK